MQFDEFCQSFELTHLDIKVSAKLLNTFNTSCFFARFIQQHPQLLKHTDWFLIDDISVLQQDIEALFAQIKSYDELAKTLRNYRQQVHAKLVFQQHHKIANFETIAKTISAIAKHILFYAQQYLLQKISETKTLNRLPQDLAILTLGKLGGTERNDSSDIDLVFIQVDNAPLTDHLGKTYSAMSFYTELGQKLIALLNKTTIDGFVYRVDMRLRPFGEGAPLVIDIESFKHYLMNHARDWERYAYIKADILHPSHQVKGTLDHMISQFVYRHYHDYRMLNAIRDMKQKILSEMKQANLTDNIKLGRGGIREIEFICQCYQLIYGGQNITLQHRKLKQALRSLTHAEVISVDTQKYLYQHYVFLRNVENALQMFDDQQTHQLPSSKHTQNAIACLCGFDDWQMLITHITQTREKVADFFDKLTRFNLHKVEQMQDSAISPTLITEHNLPAYAYNHTEIKACANDSPKRVGVSNHCHTHNSHLAIGGNIVTTEINHFFAEHILAEEALPAIEDLINLCVERYPQLLTNLLKLLHNLSKRQTYLFLFLEYRSHHLDFLTLLNQDARIVEILTEHPFLLERAFIYKHHDEVYIDIAYLRSKLYRHLQAINLEDVEAFLECLRRFKLEEIFNIIVSESRGHISLMEASDLFSHLATVLIEIALDGAWREVFRYVDITSDLQQAYRDSLAVIAYGKLGGLELSVASDLDLVFIHDKTHTELSSRFFVRAVQKFVHFMQIKTYHGALYDIDLRLRPEGDNGFITPSFDRYEEYLYHSAWTWEHQALTRARFICGASCIQQKFDQLRTQVLCQSRALPALKKDIREMRQKMRTHLLKAPLHLFDLKQSPGAMVDIEFIAQFFALYYSHKVPAIGYYSDSIRIIQTMESAQLLDTKTANLLIDNYCYYRDLGFKCYLRKQEAVVRLDTCKQRMLEVEEIWRTLIE
jgi:glutamate-ammonia-ligase adenylyltransferase